MARKSTMVLAVSLGALAFGAARANELDARVVVKSACLSPSETREEIKNRRLLEPFAVLKAAATQFKAEALSAKLCRSGEELVYEIALLHRDGRLLHVVTSATTGKLLAERNAREPVPKN
ncbi:MAG: hypothetical protein E7774_10985 [Bradyrhizobium sp.]|nr:MAG: hypothetical protein E7774_10985 [Bradyrhizobium sp.]